ncbi:hypothetical protein ARAM_007612 [Aspergillus rambellii]|uniref:RING-type E3 ubiquitin transferase n=1 Tax=Aspergillus rambellii TaxID=308745 RepID=A0A0F8U620_9EURO|nr:hypothetical protein ARAM_007612 [Aspergillus rambellii]
MGLLQVPFLFHLPPTLFFSSFPSFLLFVLFSTFYAVDSTVLPSNNSADLSWSGQLKFHLVSTQVDLSGPISLAPLTWALVSLNRSQLATLDLTGTLVDATNTPSLNGSDIAVISCDQSAYPGKLDASATVDIVLNSQQRPSAVLLYSTVDSHCNYTRSTSSDYDSLFTLLGTDSANTLLTQLNSLDSTGTSHIVYNMSSAFIPANTSADGGDGSGQAANSPNTAMIILYSITGIITALFLSIIITGAIRAHRHPERYGPRQRPGRPRQSRARGIARAMLETIPIVKFDDGDEGRVEADKGDLEMSMASEVTTADDQPHQPPMATGGTAPTPNELHETQRNPTTTPSPESNQERRAGNAETETSAEHPNFSCPICTDDFVKGQDMRVLPCNHQFHPECIDPWLVNVSGTCPLCRIDLNPPQAGGEDETEGTEGAAETAHDSTSERPTEEAPHHRHRRISSYLHSTLNARRMRDASVEERLAALRSVREESSRGQPGSGEETAAEQRRRSRLSARLRDRFRIRTRAHGEVALQEESNS